MGPYLLLGVFSSRHCALESCWPRIPGPEKKTHNGKAVIIIRGPSKVYSVERQVKGDIVWGEGVNKISF